MAVKDSMLYDVAGNLEKTINRRGDVITTDYDSRNRDTLTVIPGVGTILKQYGGPQDQLTRVWYNSATDSIGGVNSEIRWGYDVRGRLRADTAYTMNLPRGTTYTYDQWERARSVTDPVGTWTIGYEGRRGYADTLLTPLGDTLTYVQDDEGRAVGPYIRSNGLRHWSELDWNINQSLDSIGTMTNGVAGNFVSGRYIRPNPLDDGYIALAPVWVEQHGMGTPIDSLQDVVAYDGWERLTSWSGLKNGVSIVAETYQFDRTGNISQATGAATYDVVTDRLMSRVEPGGNRTFVYDRAGNVVQQTKLSTGEVRTFGYDGLNRLVSVRQGGVLMARYGYDVLGRRIAKRVYSNASGGVPGYTRFIYHGDNVAFQADSAGTMGLRFTWGLGTDDLRAVGDAAGQNYYIVQDKLGSVRGLFDRNGTWYASARFNPYGDVVAMDSAGPTPPIWYAWTGREFDAETGWFYHRARYYSPLIRRFMQEDPIGYDGGDNLYAYVEGRALETKDPSGTAMTTPEDVGAGHAGGGIDPGLGITILPDLVSVHTWVNNAWMLYTIPPPPNTGGGGSSFWASSPKGGGGSNYSGPTSPTARSTSPVAAPATRCVKPKPKKVGRFLEIGRARFWLDQSRKGGEVWHWQGEIDGRRIKGVINAVTGELMRHGRENPEPLLAKYAKLFIKYGFIGEILPVVGPLIWVEPLGDSGPCK